MKQRRIIAAQNNRHAGIPQPPQRMRRDIATAPVQTLLEGQTSKGTSLLPQYLQQARVFHRANAMPNPLGANLQRIPNACRSGYFSRMAGQANPASRASA